MESEEQRSFRRRSHSCSLLDDVIIVDSDEIAFACLLLRDRSRSRSCDDLLEASRQAKMGDEQPRYPLRSSPMKAPAPSGRQIPPEGRPAPPSPALRQVPSSPKRFAAMLERAQSTAFLPTTRDALSSSVDQKVEGEGGTSSSTATAASRRLTFASQPSSSVQQQLQQQPSLIGSRVISSSNLGVDRSLRKNATFFSLSTASFIPRVRSTACLPVAPLVPRETTVDQGAPAATAPPIPPPRRSKSKLELLQPDRLAAGAEAVALEGGAPSSSSFARPVVPPRPTQHDKQQVQQVQLQQSTSGLQRSAGGLSRCPATTRLLPAAEVLQEKEKSVEAAAGTTAAAAPAADERAEEPKRKSVAPPPVPPRRLLVPSASVACLRGIGEGPEQLQQRQPRPLLAPSPSTSAIRVRPPSPSRIAKTNSGLLRSAASVLKGAAAAATTSAAASSTVPAAAAARPPESPSKRGRPPTVTPRLPPKPAPRSAVAAGGEESTVVSTASIIIDPKEEQAAQTPESSTPRQPRARLAPSPSESNLRKRPPTPRIPRSASAIDLPIDNKRDQVTVAPPKDTVLPQKQKDTVVLPDSPSKQRQGPPASPATRSLKRRLQSGTSPDKGETAAVESPAMDHRSSTATVGSVTTVPSASFFLRNSIVISDAATPPPLVVRGNGPGAGVTLAKSTPETTPKAARRSKKMRRLELENGDVDDEARELATENAAKTKPRPRSSPIKTGTMHAAGAHDNCAASAAEDVEMTDGQPGPSSLHPITPLNLPPAPERSAMRRAKKMEEKKGARSVRFRYVHIFLFGREQGFLSVPSSGEVCLGMEARHHDEERHRLDGEVEDEDGMEVERGGGMYGEDEEELSDGEIRPLNRVRMPAHSSPRRLPPGEKYTIRHIEPLSSKHRSRLLKTSGVKIMRDPVAAPEHEYIRQRRRECGCSCEGGICVPGVCECSRDGIACQVDTEEGPFPCKCRPDSCQNDQGRVEFNAKHVHEHWQNTFRRLKTIAKLGDDSLGSPTLIRFNDDDEGPKHNATSYLPTPPPAIYQSPSISCGSSSSPLTRMANPAEKKNVMPSLMHAPQSMSAPPMQQLQQGRGGARGSREAARAAELDDPPHARFPVTPVYKKFSGKGHVDPMSLSRLDIFKSSSAREVQVVITPEPSSSTVPDDVIVEDEDERQPEEQPEVVDLDDSMDTLSNYATPPEGRSPATSQTSPQATVATVAPPVASDTPDTPPQPSSPRKFALFRSLV